MFVRECMCEKERARVCERECVCESVCVRKRERESVSEIYKKSVCERVYV